MSILLVICLIFLTCGIVFAVIDFALGYNLTKNDIAEGRILQLCIDWKIENKSCSQIYGSITNDNGEPLK